MGFAMSVGVKPTACCRRRRNGTNSCEHALKTNELLNNVLAGCPLEGSRERRMEFLIFGDSLAEDQSHVTSGKYTSYRPWPARVPARLGLRLAGNFAKKKTESKSLMRQLNLAREVLRDSVMEQRAQTVVIVHSGGNDFIGAELGYNPFKAGNNWLARLLCSFPAALRTILTNISDFLDCLVADGYRRFFVCDIPATSAIPVLQIARLAGIDAKGRMAAQGLDDMLEDFRERHKPVAVRAARVPEVQLLEDVFAEEANAHGWLAAARSLFLADFFHPSNTCHARLVDRFAEMLGQDGVGCLDTACDGDDDTINGSGPSTGTTMLYSSGSLSGESTAQASTGFQQRSTDLDHSLPLLAGCHDLQR